MTCECGTVTGAHMLGCPADTYRPRVERRSDGGKVTTAPKDGRKQQDDHNASSKRVPRQG